MKSLYLKRLYQWISLALIAGIAQDAFVSAPSDHNAPRGSLAALDPERSACVILLHGLARTARSMNKLAEALEEEGYFVVNQGYASREYPIATLAEETLPAALKKCHPHPRVHVVTHSMGGILLRYYMQHTEDSKSIRPLQRVVMLGPPNRGSQVVDNLRRVPGFKWLNGPAGLQLGTDAQSVPMQLGPAQGEVGIIAGSRSINLLLSLYLPNPDDGKVAVENTKLEGMTDHLVVAVSHPFLMRNQGVIQQVISFLARGEFKRES